MWGVRGARTSSLDIPEPVIEAALIYPPLFAETHDINLPPTVPVLPSDR